MMSRNLRKLSSNVRRIHKNHRAGILAHFDGIQKQYVIVSSAREGTGHIFRDRTGNENVRTAGRDKMLRKANACRIVASIDIADPDDRRAPAQRFAQFSFQIALQITSPSL